MYPESTSGDSAVHMHPGAAHPDVTGIQPELFHRRLEWWAQTTPDAIALEFGEERLTYAEFNRRANMLASHLNAKIPKDGHRFVGLCLDRGPDMIVSVFATFKAGCAFLPLDPSYPRGRLQFMLEDARPAMVVGRRQTGSVIPAAGFQRLDLDSFWSGTAAPPENLEEEPASSSPAYIIYTSGTTGRPKGVLIAHEGVSSICGYLKNLFGLQRSDRILQFASFNFDAIIWELVFAFSSGATLVTARREDILPGPSLTRFLQERAISVAILSPSVLAQIGGANLPDLRVLVSAGEACTQRIVKDWSPGRYFYNAYGPTEATVGATCARLENPAETPTIGKALPDKTIHLLDESLNPSALREVGEICIGGTGLAIGYLNNPALTAEKFVYPPHLKGERVYRSGDLAQMLPDGNLEYIGRRDQQLKIRGFRIELGEIENLLCQHDQVAGAVVLAASDATGRSRLTAYVLLRFPWLSSSADPVSLRDETPVVTDPVLAGEIRAYAKKALPDHMVPSQFVLLKNLPLTAHGKVDREAISKIQPAPIHANPAPPETDTEKRVATIWENALCVESIGRFDNFFDLGGDSLATAQVGIAVERDFRIPVPQHLLHSAPVLHHLARSIEFLRNGLEDLSLRQVKNIDLKAEARHILELRVKGRKAPAENPATFLTGATGFLGAFLLHRLLLKTKSDIFCLVRASNAERGKSRLRDVLSKYGLAHADFDARVWVIPGDISTPRFGFPMDVFTRLSEMIDVIYHSAAILDWIAPYEQIKETNVFGTKHVLELATHGAAIPVHYISSIGVLLSSNWHQAGRLREESDLDECAQHRMGYLQTKWVAERMIHHLRDQGLPIAVFRPPFISGDSVAGAYNTEHDFLAHKIKTCLEMESAPETGFCVNMTPVDFVADAIVHLSTGSDWEGKAFHFANPEPFDWERWCNRLEDAGYRIARLSYREWLDEIVQKGPGNPLYRMLPFLKDRGPHEVQTLYESFHGPLDIGQEQTLAGLRGTGIECPPTSSLIDVYLPALIRTGFLPAPQCR